MASRPHRPFLSIIIPVYRETGVIRTFLRGLLALDFPCSFEIIVSDGEATAGTLACIRRDALLPEHGNLRLIPSPKGRGTQLNAGAARAGGDLFLFLHADTRLDQKGMDLLVRAFRTSAPERFCGAFDLAIDEPGFIFRVIERLSSLRSRVTRLPYGDQGIFISRELFLAVKGFPNQPIMEDVGLMQKVKRRSIHPIFLAHTVVTSARRWETEGVLFTTFRNWTLITLYFLGVSPRTLHRYYKTQLPPQQP